MGQMYFRGGVGFGTRGLNRKDHGMASRRDAARHGFVEGLENGESASTGPLHRIPKARGDQGEMDRRRVLKEVAALEQTVRSLKEIVTTEGERSVAAKGAPKRQRRKAGSKS